MLCLSLFISSLYFIIYIRERLQLSSLPKPKEFIPDATEFSSIPNAAYVFLGLGAQANQMNCEAAIESLVRIGGWDGKVYLYTDAPRCYDRQKILANSGISYNQLRIVEIDEDFGHDGFDFVHPDILTRKNRLRSAGMKARLFDYIDDPAIDTIAYADCDILFAQQGCPKDFVVNGPSWEEKNIRFSNVVFFDNGTIDWLHTGTMVAHREYSKDAMTLWYEEVSKFEFTSNKDGFKYPHDTIQAELNRRHNRSSLHLSALAKNRRLRGYGETDIDTKLSYLASGDPNRKSSHHVRHEESSRLLREGRQRSNITLRNILRHPDISQNPMRPGLIGNHSWHYERFVNPITGNTVCMNHIAKDRCTRFGRYFIQQYVNRFNLKTYENSIPYCTHPALQPLLYGWFPFSYLPYCPKIEKIL